ncbi:MAG: hypothetical protein ABH986_06935 [archaeon]
MDQIGRITAFFNEMKANLGFAPKTVKTVKAKTRTVARVSVKAKLRTTKRKSVRRK